MAVIQIVRFRIKTGIDEAMFRAVNARYQKDVTPKLPGLERREATVGADGEWLLVLRFKDADSAHSAAQSDNSPIAQAMQGAIDQKSMSTVLYEVVSE